MLMSPGFALHFFAAKYLDGLNMKIFSTYRRKLKYRSDRQTYHTLFSQEHYNFNSFQLSTERNSTHKNIPKAILSCMYPSMYFFKRITLFIWKAQLQRNKSSQAKYFRWLVLEKAIVQLQTEYQNSTYILDKQYFSALCIICMAANS